MLKITFPYRGYSKTEFIKKALYWANTQSHFAYYQSNGIDYPHHGFQETLAIGCKDKLSCDSQNAFETLKAFHRSRWLFGYLGYDLKNDVEKLSSDNPDHAGFADMQFFVPNHILFFEHDAVRYDNPDLIEHIISTVKQEGYNSFTAPKRSVTKEKYVQIVDQLREHIEEGDCYEVNFCQEFHGKVKSLDPIAAYLDLSRISPKPFSCLQKFDDRYIISASPERFLKKTGNKLVSQPIKGTRPRSEDQDEDIRLKIELRNDEKELAENMMIVDLVRNDLARTAQTGTVKVEEMFGIYSFEQVHQMISTVTSVARDDIHFIDMIKNTFPMGSMTGAPKVKVMQLIERYENTKRGVFSGASGYISPEGDFDFNVLIRSLFLNAAKQTYSFQVGSAITYDSVGEKEYDECLVKAKALFQLLAENTKTKSTVQTSKA